MKVTEYGYEYDAIPDERLLAETGDRTTRGLFRNALCMRSGRDAIKAVAREYLPTVALLPALACDSMVLPFLTYRHTVEYYRLNGDYSLNTDSLVSLIEKHGDKQHILFLYIDYFGNKAIADTDLTRLQNEYPNLVFIEDITHNLFVNNEKAFTPDYTIASLRKWAEIPDGGLLWAHRALSDTSFSDSIEFSKTRLAAQAMRHEFLRSGDKKLKIEYRGIFSTVTDIIDNDREPARMSEYAFRLAGKINWSDVAARRAANAGAMIRIFGEAGIPLIQNTAGTGDVYVGILIENRDEIQKKLSAEGIFCTIIWPLSAEQKAACETAKYTEEHMLAVYCDQRYTVKEAEYVASKIVRLVNE